MMHARIRHWAIVVALSGASACTTPARTAPEPVSDPTLVIAEPSIRVVRNDAAAIERARQDSMRSPYTEADVRFLTHMIPHHAQAILMSRLASTHGASTEIRRLAARIINAQQDEIAIMQQWLADRQKPIPEAHTHLHPPAGSGDHAMHAQHMQQSEHAAMPGMLTDAQLKQLDAARGAEFDRTFLTFMIQHHRGAVQMIKELLASSTGAHDETIFRLAADINVDQTTEIARMESMLAAMKP